MMAKLRGTSHEEIKGSRARPKSLILPLHLFLARPCFVVKTIQSSEVGALLSWSRPKQDEANVVALAIVADEAADVVEDVPAQLDDALDIGPDLPPHPFHAVEHRLPGSSPR